MNTREQLLKRQANAALDRLALSVMLLERTMSLACAFAFDVGMLGPEGAANAYSAVSLAAALGGP